ncbi:DUF956 family protein [Lentilactobacillus laojiaonis]|uniref:DUF956 family protein n=1 Tax=Lentilactobacillus laojiaonis TaxID=2883998 RepID=UPI001D0B838D|nr:DUF956 family protein [Lentilactobacillus laojiaonis]UDM31886.1 DUF956 family protein [Lentilactobacillus laojiaonis]
MNKLLKFQTHNPLNQFVEKQVNANLFVNQLTAMAGSLTLGNTGVEFERQFKNGFIQIPYSEIKSVEVQIIFKKFYRGIFIETNEGQRFNFVTSKTKDLVHVFNRKLPSGKVKRYVHKKKARQ